MGRVCKVTVTDRVLEVPRTVPGGVAAEMGAAAPRSSFAAISSAASMYGCATASTCSSVAAPPGHSTGFRFAKRRSG
eukprot:4191313-Prorocentrum_lima.AAC.1